MTAVAGRRSWWILAILLTVYAACALRLAAVHLPFCDEGWLASPGWNLDRHGTMETSVIEPAGSYLTGIDRYTYWIMPLYPLGLALWYKLWGFGLFQMRSYSTFWGVIALAAIFLVVLRLARRESVALVAVALTGTSLLFVSNGSTGRMDMMSAGLGFAALAAYLALRERNFTQAVAASHCLLAMAVFSHPNALIHFVSLCFLTAWLDWRKIRIFHLLLASAPYLAGIALWGLYIREGGIAMWRAQFAGNATAGGRDLMFTHPLAALWLEVKRRYAIAFGFGPGSTLAQHLQMVPLLFWIGGVVAAFFMRGIRDDHRCRALLILALLCPAILAIIDGVKRPFYLIYAVPFAIAVLSLVLASIRRQTCARITIGALLFFQTAGLVVAMRRDAFHGLYLPVTNFLKGHRGPGTLILGPSELGFQLGYGKELDDDFRLGYNSGKTPDYIVIDPNYRAAIDAFRSEHPDIYRFDQRRLENEYVPVFSNANYTIYSRSAAVKKNGISAAAVSGASEP